VTFAFTAAVFRGVREVTLKASQLLPEFFEDHMDFAKSMSNAIVTSLSSSLIGSPSMQKLTLDISDASPKVLADFIDTSIPSMPNLRDLAIPAFREYKDFADTMTLDRDCANLLLAVVRRCSHLRNVTYRLPREASCDDKVLHSKIQCQCEMNRIDYASLLTADVPVALWPLILGNIKQRDVLLSLIREKNDSIFVNLHNRRCGCKRKLEE
jgi:hypothetical protein